MSNVISAAASGLPFPTKAMDFELGQLVSVPGTDVSGFVTGRTQYLDGLDKFGVCFIDADNLERTRWYSCRNLVRA